MGSDNAPMIATVAEALLPGGVAGCTADNCKDLVFPHPCARLPAAIPVFGIVKQAHSRSLFTIVGTQGNSMLAKGKVSDAVWLYSLGLAKREGCHVLHSNRSAAHARLLEYDDALRDADMCIRVKPDWARGYGRRAAALEGKGRHADALVCYQKVLELEPGNAAATAAIEALDKKLDDQPQAPSANPLGGDGPAASHTGSGGAAEATDGASTSAAGGGAAEPVADSAEVKAEKVERHKQRGNKAFAAGNFEDAIDHFSSAIELDKGNHVLFSNRSGAYASVNQFQSALNDAQKCVNLAPTWPKGYGRKAAALIGLNRRAQALDAYRQGLKHDPLNALLLRGLAELSPNDPLVKPAGTGADAQMVDSGDASAAEGATKEATGAEEAVSGSDRPADGTGTGPSVPEEKKDPAPKKPELPEMDSEEMELLSSFMADTSNLERKLQVERIIKHKLNPFEVLQIKPVNTAEEMNLAYRKISLMVHPDKCKHPMAEEAFEICKKSLAELQDEEKRPFYLECWEASRLEGERELKKLRKKEKEDAAKNKKATVEEVANLKNAFLGGAVRHRKRNREGKKKDEDKEKDDQESFKAADEGEFTKEDEDKIAEFQREAAYRILQQLERRRAKAEKVFIANEKRSKEALAKLGEKEKFEEVQEDDWGKDRLDRIDSWRDFQNHGTRMGIKKPKPSVTEKGVSVLPPTMGGLKKTAEEDELEAFLDETGA